MHLADAHKLDPTGDNVQISLSLIKKLDNAPEWPTGIKVDNENKMLFIWSTDCMTSYKLDTFETIFIWNKLSDGDDGISAGLYMPKYRYTILGFKIK